MTTRKYTARTWHQVYCSSSGHHFAKVTIYDGKRVIDREWDFATDCVLQKNSIFPYRGYPQYLLDDIKRKFRESYLKEDLEFYEVNQDGVKRFDNLRYHDDEIFARRVGVNETTEQRAQRLFNLFVAHRNDKPKPDDFKDYPYSHEAYTDAVYEHEHIANQLRDKLQKCGCTPQFLMLDENGKTHYALVQHKEA